MSLKLLFLASLALSFQISATNVAKYTDTIGNVDVHIDIENAYTCLLYTSPSPRD